MSRLAVLFGLLFLTYAGTEAHAQESVKRYLGEAQRSIHEKNYPAAISRLKRALSKASDRRTKATIKNAIGWSYFSSGNITEAKKYLTESYREATAENFKDVARRAANNLGLLAFSQDNLEEARGFFTSKWAKDSYTAQTYIGLIDSKLETEKVNGYISTGITYRLNRQFTEAVAEYDKALALSPKNVRALEYKGYSLFRLGQYERAMAAFRKALAIEPERVGILLNMLKTQCAAKNLDQARTLVSKHRELIEASRQTFARDGEFNKVCGPAFLSDRAAAGSPRTANDTTQHQ